MMFIDKKCQKEKSEKNKSTIRVLKKLKSMLIHESIHFSCLYSFSERIVLLTYTLIVSTSACKL